jgi:hypothetical protein
MPEHCLDLTIEMDSLPVQPSATGKSPVSHKPALSRRDYIVGICLLLLVVFLWTTSNFVTQVRLECQSHHWSVQFTIRMLSLRICSSEDTENLSCSCHPIFHSNCGSLTVSPCSITYLSTSTFALYLLPYLIKSYIRKHHGGPDPRGGLG